MHVSGENGFTLIELSIVLVVIGLIIGGVLVGRDMISASEVRATISQIEKYQTATRTFQGKYGGLPGDLNALVATQFGFAARGAYPGQGDGNGVLEATNGNGASFNWGFLECAGELPMYWVDLSSVNLIDGGFNTATPTYSNPGSNITGTSIDKWFPQAKLGRGNYIYVWSGGVEGMTHNAGNGINYFGLSAVTQIDTSPSFGAPFSTPALTVQQAYNIDKKTDDGLPQSGRVTTLYVNQVGAGGPGSIEWAAGAGGEGAYGANHAPTTNATTATSATCYDNGGASGATQQYSLGQNNGNGVNCALSFQFQ